jgi:hypothetical protein
MMRSKQSVSTRTGRLGRGQHSCPKTPLQFETSVISVPGLSISISPSASTGFPRVRWKGLITSLAPAFWLVGILSQVDLDRGRFTYIPYAMDNCAFDTSRIPFYSIPWDSSPLSWTETRAIYRPLRLNAIHYWIWRGISEPLFNRLTVTKQNVVCRIESQAVQLPSPLSRP